MLQKEMLHCRSHWQDHNKFFSDMQKFPVHLFIFIYMFQELGEKRSEVEKELTDSKEALQEAKRQIANYEVILISDIIGYKDEVSSIIYNN